MEHHFAELIGVAAAAASLYAAHAKTIIPLRIAAIVATLTAMRMTMAQRRLMSHFRVSEDRTRYRRSSGLDVGRFQGRVRRQQLGCAAGFNVLRQA